MAWGTTITSSGWSTVSTPYDWVTTTLTGTAASTTLTIPDFGNHLEIEVMARSDNAATTISLLTTWNGDTTATDYFWQRGGGSGNAGVTAQGNTAACTLMPAANGVTSYFGYANLYFPMFRDTGKLRDCYVSCTVESSASNRTVHVVSHRRTTAGSGALTDRVSSVTFTPSAGNWIAGSIFRYRVQP